MIPIRYPPYDFKFKNENEKKFIFDELRKFWVTFTAEEWVRQNFIQYLLQVKLYPAAFIAIEKEIRLGELKKRFDLLVYDRDHKPWMLIECKEQAISLEKKVLDQVLRYHISVPVPYLVVTNGVFCAGFGKKEKKLVALTEIPEFPVMSN
ncbi:MAG TPA: type I restriction enzyme HsdR N-terminal domain-containing protein [Flavitalea sp.]|nr:type I restriction enzyme HsdR N-terminal domain-containing protein [Flavitalea sp.]